MDLQQGFKQFTKKDIRILQTTSFLESIKNERENLREERKLILNIYDLSLQKNKNSGFERKRIELELAVNNLALSQFQMKQLERFNTAYESNKEETLSYKKQIDIDQKIKKRSDSQKGYYSNIRRFHNEFYLDDMINIYKDTLEPFILSSSHEYLKEIFNPSAFIPIQCNRVVNYEQHNSKYYYYTNQKYKKNLFKCKNKRQYFGPLTKDNLFADITTNNFNIFKIFGLFCYRCNFSLTHFKILSKEVDVVADIDWNFTFCAIRFLLSGNLTFSFNDYETKVLKGLIFLLKNNLDIDLDVLYLPVTYRLVVILFPFIKKMFRQLFLVKTKTPIYSTVEYFSPVSVSNVKIRKNLDRKYIKGLAMNSYFQETIVYRDLEFNLYKGEFFKPRLQLLTDMSQNLLFDKESKNYYDFNTVINFDPELKSNIKEIFNKRKINKILKLATLYRCNLLTREEKEQFNEQVKIFNDFKAEPKLTRRSIFDVPVNELKIEFLSDYQQEYQERLMIFKELEKEFKALRRPTRIQIVNYNEEKEQLNFMNKTIWKLKRQK